MLVVVFGVPRYEFGLGLVNNAILGMSNMVDLFVNNVSFIFLSIRGSPATGH